MATTPKYVWRGPKDLKRGRAKWIIAGGRVTVTFDITGPYQQCITQFPAPGSIVSGYSGLPVSGLEIEEGDGDTGVIHVTLEATISEASYSTAVVGEPVYEIEWGELQKPLETHPDCGVLWGLRPAGPDGKKKTWDDWADLNPDDYVAGNWSLEEYKSLKEKGIDSYSVGAPIVRRKLYYHNRPAGVGAASFKKQNPPAEAGAPGGYEWLAGVDRLVKEGRLYTRDSEWIGAENVETLIYSNA